ncbi:MAG: ABC transporter permease [Candidatus Pacearchaeota archaeon]|jgi:putative ABC transport system permease protein
MVNYFSFAGKNLKRRGIRSWLTLLGIFIGVASVIALITLGSGLKAAVNSQFGVSSTQAITVQAGGLSYGPPGSTVVNPLTRDDAEAIEKLSTVEFTSPRNIEFLEREYNDNIEFGYALSMDEGSESEMYEVMGLEVEKGRLLEKGDLGKVILGNNVQYEDKNGFGKDIEVGKKILIEGKKFTVIGILDRQGSFTIDNIILMYDQDLNELVNYGDDVDIIGVKVKSLDLMDKAKEEIEKLMRNRRDVKKGEEDFEVSTPDAILEDVNSILNGIQIFIILIASISIVVGAIGIVNTMATSVIEREKEIGIMKAIGAKNEHIFFQFLVESGLLGAVGGFLGIVFGLILGYLGNFGINYFLGSSSQPSINILLIIFSLTGSFLIGATAGIVPAMHASGKNPVEALR